MSDRKRLEEIKNLLEQYYAAEDSFEQTDLAISIIQGHTDWLIQQAERVPEYLGHIDRIQRENERLRRALNFYADQNNYGQKMIEPFVFSRPIESDNGRIARHALKGESE